ncbi:hypothetical protein ACIGBN_16995 [Marinomonas sp. NPDC078689]|uniref:hypothetical protein n=1 Tax=Marinomonas sp. NPDC078689 TaxID=3364147 RepID=UPI0037CA7066
MRPVNELTNKKREAVRLRLGGLSLAQVKAKTGLSVPTIVSAMSRFKTLGWQGLEPGERGRKPSIKKSAKHINDTLLQVMKVCFQEQHTFCSVDSLLAVYQRHHKAISKKTLLRRLNQLLPEQDHKVVFEKMAQFIALAADQNNATSMAESECALVAESALTLETQALLAKSKRLVLGFYPMGDTCVFYTQDRRGERRFAVYIRPPAEPSSTLVNATESALSETSLVEQLNVLVQEASPEKPVFVVIKTDSLARYRKLATWQVAHKNRCFLFAQWKLPERVE